jgi:hypothetical protein
MKLSDLFEDLRDELLFNLVTKRLGAGDKVVFDRMHYARDHTVWQTGTLLDLEAGDPYTLRFGKDGSSANIPRITKVMLPPALFGKLHLYKEGDHWKLSDRKPQEGDEPVAESFGADDSLVMSMISKALKADTPVKIAVKNDRSADKWEAKGYITAIRFEPHNRDYCIRYEPGYDEYTGEYRFRSPSHKMFDNTFTLKKVDGVLTFMKRESHGD